MRPDDASTHNNPGSGHPGLFADFFAELPDHLQEPEPGSPRARILDAARAIFAEQGFDAASTRAIAEHADVNQAMIHYYYQSKLKLYETVLQAELLHVFSEVSASLSPGMSEPDILSRLPVKLAEVFLHNPVRSSLLRRDIAGNPQRLVEMIHSFGEYGPMGFVPRLRTMIDQGRSNSSIRDDVPPEAMIRFLISLAYGLLMTAPMAALILDQDVHDPAVFEQLKPPLSALIRGAIQPGGHS